jgi:hypothetical protein
MTGSRYQLFLAKNDESLGINIPTDDVRFAVYGTDSSGDESMIRMASNEVQAAQRVTTMTKRGWNSVRVEPVLAIPVRPLSAEPRKCATPAEHECKGTNVYVAVGAYPCCSNGVIAEFRRREAELTRREEIMKDPKIAAEIRWEQRMEARYS